MAGLAHNVLKAVRQLRDDAGRQVHWKPGQWTLLHRQVRRNPGCQLTRPNLMASRQPTDPR